jgi:hypothetical protein
VFIKTRMPVLRTKQAKNKKKQAYKKFHSISPAGT